MTFAKLLGTPILQNLCKRLLLDKRGFLKFLKNSKDILSETSFGKVLYISDIYLDYNCTKKSHPRKASARYFSELIWGELFVISLSDGV